MKSPREETQVRCGRDEKEEKRGAGEGGGAEGPWVLCSVSELFGEQPTSLITAILMYILANSV